MSFSINIDFGAVLNGPDDDYAGAGTAGFWNVLDSVNTAGVSGIMDIEGNLTGVSIATSQGMVDVTPNSQPFLNDDGLILGDYLVGGSNTFTMSFTGLDEGLYSVIVYTTGRQDFSRSSTVAPFGDPLALETNTGSYAGLLEEGVTHSIHEVNVGVSGLSLEISSPGDGFVNAIQISPVPEAATSALLIALCAFAVTCFRRRKN